MRPTDGSFCVHQTETMGGVETALPQIHGAADQDFAQFTAFESPVFTPNQCGDACQVGIRTGRAAEAANKAAAIRIESLQSWAAAITLIA